MKIKHSKYKNSGILFELLVRQITSDTLEGKSSPIKELLKKYFFKTELGKEYRLYEALLKKTSLTEGKANMVIDTLLASSKTLNRRIIKKQKYNLIKELQNHYDLNKFFNYKLPNYKVYAAFYTLLEATSSDTTISPEYIINNKVTILEHLSAAPVSKDRVKDDVMEELLKEDKDVKFLTYKILLENFNNKYDNLNYHQKSILKELVNSVDNSPKLKEFYIAKSEEIKQELIKINKSTNNNITKIKIKEVISLIKPINKNTKINDNNLVDLLQYCDLLTELESANVR